MYFYLFFMTTSQSFSSSPGYKRKYDSGIENSVILEDNIKMDQQQQQHQPNVNPVSKITRLALCSKFNKIHERVLGSKFGNNFPE